MRTIRIFISSPSDANRERDRLTRVARRLNSIYSEQVDLQIIRWEDDFYRAHETFQTQIPEAKTCDIVIGILKHRLGSPLPSTFPPMPEREPFFGEPYPSGTAYEILSSIANRLLFGGDKPDIYVFRDAEPPVVSLGSGDMERIGTEWRRLEDFARRFFFTAEGDFRFAFQTFRSANQFEEQIEALLRKWIETNVYAEHRANWPVETKGSPFRALDVFDFDHREVFFGRDRDTARIVDLLTETAIAAREEGSGRLPFLLVIGPSGSGKSSLLRAGVVPSLTGSAAADTEQWRVAVMTPSMRGKGAFHGLAAALLDEKPKAAGIGPAADAGKGGLKALPELRDGAFSTADALASLLSHGDASASAVILDALRRVETALAAKETFERPPRVRLLLVIDQLDEIFSGEVEAADRAAFAALLAVLAATDSVWIVASLRAGLYENFLGEPGFFALRNAGDIYELGPPGTTELADIVRKPAQAADILYEKDPVTGRTLDEILLADFDRPDMLPLLQFTLEALFQLRQTRDGVMTLTQSAYRTMNGMAGAVETAAGAAMAKITEDERAKLPKLLRRLVATGQTAEGEAAPLILRDVPAARLQHDPGMLRLAEALTETRLLVAGGTSAETRSFRLAHQRLLTLWAAAEAALKDNATFYRVSAELEQAQARWQRNGRKSSQLIRDPVLLTEAGRLVAAYRDELAADSVEFIRRSQLRARMGMIALGATAAVFAALFAGTIWFYQRSKEAELAALEQKKKAEANFSLAQGTLEGVVTDIADGLKNIEGMSIASRRTILMRVSRSIDMLQFLSADNTPIYRTRQLMLNAFGDAYAAGGDTDAALKSYEDSIALGRDLMKTAPASEKPEMERGIAANLERIGDVLLGQGQRDVAVQVFQKSMEIRQRLIKADPTNPTLQRDLSIGFDRLAQVRQASGDVKGAIEAYAAGAERTREKLKKYPDDNQAKRDLSVSLEHLADLQLQIGDRKQAGELYEEILAIRKALLARDPADTQANGDMLIALQRKAAFAASGGDQATAKKTYEDVLTLVRKLTAMDSGKVEWQRTTSVTLNNLGDIAFAENDLAKARTMYDEALAISRRISAIDAKSQQYRRDVAFGLNKIGDLERSQGHYPQATTSYEQALVIVRALAAADPAQLMLQRDVAFGLSRIADVKKALNDRDGALKAYSEALQIVQKLAAAEPDGIVWQQDVILNQTRVADMQFATGALAEAKAGYAKALEIQKKLTAAHPDRQDLSRDMAVNLNKLGDVDFNAGDIDGAGELYRSALAIVLDLIKAQPDNSLYLHDQAYCLGKVGAVEQRQKQADKAMASYAQAVEIARRLVTARFGNPGQADSDLVYTLLNVASLQHGDERLATLNEALSIADRLAAGKLLIGAQTTLPANIRAAIAAKEP